MYGYMSIGVVYILSLYFLCFSLTFSLYPTCTAYCVFARSIVFTAPHPHPLVF